MTDIGRDSVTLKWTEPEVDGGSKITGYVVEKKESWRLNWVEAARVKPTQREVKVRKLYEGHSYQFRVLAENAEGRGQPKQVRDAVTPTKPMGKC